MWLSIGITTLILAIFLWVILSAKFYLFESSRRSNTLLGSLWSLFYLQKIGNDIVTKTILIPNQFRILVIAPKIQSSKSSIYLLLCFWCMAVIVLVNAYSTTLMSYLMAPRFIPMIESIDDIVNISRPFFMVLKYTAFESVLLVVNQRTIKIVTTLFKY